MVVSLIKENQMFSITLPDKIKGQYWIFDIDNSGKKRKLISIEAIQGRWAVKSNHAVSVLDASNNPVPNMELQDMSFFNLDIIDYTGRAILFVEILDDNRKNFTKYVVREGISFLIGRNKSNQICFDNKYVSGKHAKLIYSSSGWTITDLDSKNGTYVNGYRIMSQQLNPGDLIYIMGLKIVLGHQFFAINNPDGLVEINAADLSEYQPQIPSLCEEYNGEISSHEMFYRPPRFFRKIEGVRIKIDPPPRPEKPDTVPLAFMLGPSLTMGMASLSTGIISLSNVLMNDGDILQAVPTLIMSGSMLIGTVLWPVLTKKHEKKQKIRNEKKRHEKYLLYLDEVRDRIRRETKDQSDILNENCVTVEECEHRIRERATNLWERVLGQKDFLSLRLGIGEVPLRAEIVFPEKQFSMEEDGLLNAMLSLGAEPKLLRNVPISVSLIEEMFIGIYGTYSEASNLLKSLILQMVALHSYDELKIMLIADEEDEQEWAFVKWIPHFWSNDKSIRFLATNSDEVKEMSAYLEKNVICREEDNLADYSPYYVIISVSKVLFEKCETAQKMLNLKENCGFSILMLEEELKDLPKETSTVICANGKESQYFNKNDTSGGSVTFAVEKIKEDILTEMAVELSHIELDLKDYQYNLPEMLTFMEMFQVGKVEHLNSLTRWKENNPSITLQTPIGLDTAGDVFELDLHEKFHGPHGLVAGMTGSGKSEFIITYILSLAVNYHPNEVAFILIDYKGGGLTGAFEDKEKGIKLPHLAGTITNLDGAAVKRSLVSIQSELRRRQAVFNEARKISNEGTMDIYKYQQLYRDKVVSEAVPHLFIISDEFAELKMQQPEFMQQLISTARIGRSLGVHLILATQKPSGVVDDQIWSNSKFRICLKVQEKADSQDMIKCPDAAELSQTGRFYLQVGFNEFFALGQSAWCGADYIPSERVEKKEDLGVSVIDHLGRSVMKVKANRKKKSDTKVGKQIVSIVKYLSDLATEENIGVRSLWLPPIPQKIYISDLEKEDESPKERFILNPIVGKFDDPFNQRQGILHIPFSEEGNCLLYGSTGSGKTEFLKALCYSLIRNYAVQELNLYIMDFASETLKVFEKAPQVGEVVGVNDEEKIENLLKMLDKEMEYRKGLFSEYGGDYKSYCKSSLGSCTNIVVVLNNYPVFTEQYEEQQELFTLLTREGIRYGIFFLITVSSVNGVRYRTSQNFKIMMTLQQNDAMDYAVIVGRTDGLLPSKHEGRGLIKLERVFEFQTAFCEDVVDESEYLRKYSEQLAENAEGCARRIPILPEYVNYEYVKEFVGKIESIPIGICKESLEPCVINLKNRVVYPISAQDIYEGASFISGMIQVLSEAAEVTILDSEKILAAEIEYYGKLITTELEIYVQELFSEMVKRNNTYKDSNMEKDSLSDFARNVVVITGLGKLVEKLSKDGKEKLSLLIEKAEAFYKIHFIIFDGVASFNEFTYENWYRRHCSNGDGLWIGDGITEQYFIKINKVASELYEEIGSDYGYCVVRNRETRIKLVTSYENEEVV